MTAAAARHVAVVGALTICGFFFFQYVVGLPPCPLCLEQRDAYYVCVPLAVLLWLGTNHGASSKVIIAGFAVIAAFMLWNAGLGVYHAGVEWKFWPGPQDCSGPIDKFGSAGDVLKQFAAASAWCAAMKRPAFPRSVARRLERAGIAGLGCAAAWGALASLARQKQSS